MCLVQMNEAKKIVSKEKHKNYAIHLDLFFKFLHTLDESKNLSEIIKF